MKRSPVDNAVAIGQIEGQNMVQIGFEMQAFIMSLWGAMKARERRRRILEEAWVGDAVLSLYARRRILRENGAVDAERFERMTSNRFLSSMGEPSEVEAKVGRVFDEEGLEAAFAWIEREIMPVFGRQEGRLKRLIPSTVLEVPR